MKLNLEAKDNTEHRILDYLEENVSETLADKINNGVLIEKDGKKLINKKTLSDFMEYANEEVLKLIEESQQKGTVVRCIENETVYSWAIHYFEENEIIGKLYNEDGSEYQAHKPTKTSEKSTYSPTSNQKPIQKEPTLFDLLTEEKAEENKQEEQQITKTIETPKNELNPKISPIYSKYMEVQEQYPNYIIAYRLGDFYEVFGKNAVTLAGELDLTLTGRDCGLESRVPMVGFPYHTADIYIYKAVEKGFKIAVAEDMNNVKLVDNNEEDFYLSEDEMRKFDGDVNDCYVNEDGEIINCNENILTKEKEIAKAFDKDALYEIIDLFGDLIELR